MDDGEAHTPSLRRLLLDLVEEYGRDTGHADLLREAVDGLVGEDPPADLALCVVSTPTRPTFLRRSSTGRALGL
ncbi:MAG: DinB family protein [Nocardioides sp.]|nr:DinB family protein [Nocardioides sp.]